MMYRNRLVLLLLLNGVSLHGIFARTTTMSSLSTKTMTTTTRRRVPSLLALRGGGTAASSSSSSTSSTVSKVATTVKTAQNVAHAVDKLKQASDTITSATSAPPALVLPPPGTASIPTEVFHLVKSIVGAGVLGLPAGIAAFGNHPSALIPAVALITFMGFLSAFAFSLTALLCQRTASTTYRQAWSKIVNPHTSWIPAVACVLVSSCSVLTYCMILADTVPLVFQTLTDGVIALTRTQALLGVVTIVFLPLSLLRQLKHLAPFSLLGIAGTVYTALAMLAQWLSGAYRVTQDAQGEYLTMTALAKELSANQVPNFGTKGWESVFSAHAVTLVSMLSTAFMAHYHAPRMYWELKDNSMNRFNVVVGCSFGTAILLMVAIASSGFGTFGANCRSLILNNYATTDPLMALSRLAVMVSLMGSFPLAFNGVRDGILDLVLNNPSPEKKQKWFVPATLVLLTIVTTIAYVAKDIGLILALGGATWGNCIIYLFPTYMLLKLVNSKSSPWASHNRDLRPLIPLSALTGTLGVILGVLGTTRAIQSVSESK